MMETLLRNIRDDFAEASQQANQTQGGVSHRGEALTASLTQ